MGGFNSPRFAVYVGSSGVHSWVDRDVPRQLWIATRKTRGIGGARSDRVDNQLDQLIYHAFPQTKAS
jgi:hypothetical protein